MPPEFENCKMNPDLALEMSMEIAKMTFKMRKDKCLDEAIEAYTRN